MRSNDEFHLGDMGAADEMGGWSCVSLSVEALKLEMQAIAF